MEIKTNKSKPLLDVKAFQLLENMAFWYQLYPEAPKFWQFRKWYRLACIALESIKGCKAWKDANKKKNT